MIYTTVLFLCTVFFFRDSPIGVVAMSQMAAGDGIADIIGRHVFDDSLLKVDANPLLTEPLN